jgi:hypothetical protein
MKRFAIPIDGPRRFASAAAALAAGVLLLVATPAGPAAAQTATSDTKELHRRTMMFAGQFTEEPIEVADVYTVPANRYFRITDLILTSYTNAFCDITIGRTYEIRLQPNSTLPLSFQSGPTFGPGEVVQIVSTWRLPGHGDSCRPIYTVMGYTFTVQ